MKKVLLSVALLTATAVQAQQSWTLKDCIDYAMQHNISLKKTELSKQQASEEVKDSKADLFPSLTASTNHSVGYSPWMDTSAGGKKSYYTGSYGLNAQWTVWNGSQNTKEIKMNKLAEEQAALTLQEQANSIQESIAKLYVQILYTHEAINVNRQSLEASKKNEERGQQMLEVGKMSKADLAQLTAQRATDEYNLVAMETNLANYLMQLNQLLEYNSHEAFDLAMPSASDELALAPIPDLEQTYELAVQHRPEIKNSELALKTSELQVSYAKSGWSPTVTLNGAVGSSTSSRDSRTWNEQMKRNFDIVGGVGVSIPIFDNRRNKTAIRKAKLQQQQSMLELYEERTDLHDVIEGYWLDAHSNQQKFRAAIVSVDSEQQSYDLLSEQFQLGLKNIVELMNGKTNLMQAQQNKLQSKYLTILTIQLLRFYQGEEMNI